MSWIGMSGGMTGELSLTNLKIACRNNDIILPRVSQSVLELTARVLCNS